MKALKQTCVVIIEDCNYANEFNGMVGGKRDPFHQRVVI